MHVAFILCHIFSKHKSFLKYHVIDTQYLGTRSLRKVEQWVLIDFRCASEGTCKSLVLTTGTKGSPHYFSPEMKRKMNFNNKVDIWAMGCILYELCTNSKAFVSDSSLFFYASGHEPVPQVWCSSDEPEVTTIHRATLEAIHEIWKAAQTLDDIDKSLHDQSPGSLCSEVNTLIAAMLSIPPEGRPTAKQLETHFAVNMITSKPQDSHICLHEVTLLMYRNLSRLYSAFSRICHSVLDSTIHRNRFEMTDGDL